MSAYHSTSENSQYTSGSSEMKYTIIRFFSLSAFGVICKRLFFLIKSSKKKGRFDNITDNFCAELLGLVNICHQVAKTNNHNSAIILK